MDDWSVKSDRGLRENFGQVFMTDKGISKSFWTESITKWTATNTHW